MVKTLMNAIRAERIHQAYLLTGSRGIGKTSIARILGDAGFKTERFGNEDTYVLLSVVTSRLTPAR